MTQQQILEELEHLTVAELLEVIEVATRRAKKGIELPTESVPAERLALAADALKNDYASDEELRAFTALDAEDIIHAAE